MRYRRCNILFLLTLIFIALPYILRQPQPYLEDYHENINPLEIINSNLVVSSLKIKACWKYSACAEESWHQYSTPLNLYSSSLFPSMINYYLFVQYRKFDDVRRLLTNVQFSKSSPAGDGWEKTASGIWVTYADKGNKVDQISVVRDVDVLFGSHDLVDSRPYWHYQPQPNHFPFSSSIPNHLSLLKFSNDQTDKIKHEYNQFNHLKSAGALLTTNPSYKILQLSDLHFGQDLGKCFGNHCKSDYKTIKFLEHSIAQERPDLIVITGDMIDYDRLKNFKSVILKGLAPIIKNSIPFIFTFGESDYNHENFNTKRAFLKFLSSLPYCLNTFTEDGMPAMHGLTNYHLKLFRLNEKLNPSEIQLHELTNPDALITVLDSQDHMIDSSQINYLYRINQISQHHRKISKDDDNLDLDDEIFKLLFFHYPLPNFRPIGKFKLIGKYNEKHKLETSTDIKFKNDIINCGYHVISVGHEHENDACIDSPQDKFDGVVPDESKHIWLCYNSITGDSGETKLDVNYERRFRVFNIDFEKSQLLSWKINEFNSGFDYQIIHKFSQ